MTPQLRKKLAAAGGGALAIAAVMIPDLEGVRYEPYYDVAGVLTVCYGHTGADINSRQKVHRSRMQDNAG